MTRRGRHRAAVRGCLLCRSREPRVTVSSSRDLGDAHQGSPPVPGSTRPRRAILVMLALLTIVAVLVVEWMVLRGDGSQPAQPLAPGCGQSGLICARGPDGEMRMFHPAAGAMPDGNAMLGDAAGGVAAPAAGAGYVAQPAVSVPGLGLLGGGVTGLMTSAIKVVVGWLANSLVESSRSMLKSLLGASTNPRVTASSFIGRDGAYRDVASFASLLLVGAVSLGVVQGLWTGEPGQALLRLLRDVPTAALAILVFPWLVDQLVILSNVLSRWILPPEKYSPEKVAAAILPYSTVPGGPVGILLLNQLVLLAIAAIYLELVVRTALTYVAVAVAPLSFMMMTTGSGRMAARKAVELVVAIVLIKPGVFIALRVGIDLTDVTHRPNPTDGNDWAGIMLGLAVAGVAAFMPWIIWRLIPSMEQAVIAQGLSRAPLRAGMQAMQTGYFGSSLASSLSRVGGRGATVGAAGGAAGRGASAGTGRGDLGTPRSLAPRSDSGAGRPRRGGTLQRPATAGATPRPRPAPDAGQTGRSLVDPDRPAGRGAGPAPRPRNPGPGRRSDPPRGGGR